MENYKFTVKQLQIRNSLTDELNLCLEYRTKLDRDIELLKSKLEDFFQSGSKHEVSPGPEPFELPKPKFYNGTFGYGNTKNECYSSGSTSDDEILLKRNPNPIMYNEADLNCWSGDETGYRDSFERQDSWS